MWMAYPIMQKRCFTSERKTNLPPRRPTWRYRWHGREAVEGEMQVNSDLSVQAITFSKKGEQLSGIFKWDFIGTCEFTGVKKGLTQLGMSPDLEYEWDDGYIAGAY
jgi:hypothetical protein